MKTTKEQITKINDFLKCRNIKASVVGAQQGLRTCKYQLKLDMTEKVSKIRALEEDLFLHIRSYHRPKIYVDSSQGLVIIETTTNPRDIEIPFTSLLEEVDFSSMEIPLLFGRNMKGKPAKLDLIDCPHMMIGGTTGSGKSVLLRSLIYSMIHKYPQQDVGLELLLMDPKGTELNEFKDFPQTLGYTSTYESSIEMLERTVEYMEDRYQLMAKHRINDIRQLRSLPRDPKDPVDPYVVMIIDECADLFLQDDSKAFTSLITKLAQKSRAAGIHIIMSTQNPKRSMFDGLIKANITTSVALKTSTAIESKIILNIDGAEKLVGKGDMLIKHNGSLVRVQGALPKKLTFGENNNIPNVIDITRNK